MFPFTLVGEPTNHQAQSRRIQVIIDKILNALELYILRFILLLRFKLMCPGMSYSLVHDLLLSQQSVVNKELI